MRKKTQLLNKLLFRFSILITGVVRVREDTHISLHFARILRWPFFQQSKNGTHRILAGVFMYAGRNELLIITQYEDNNT